MAIEKKVSLFKKAVSPETSTNTYTAIQNILTVPEQFPTKDVLHKKNETVLFQLAICKNCEAVGHMMSCWACDSKDVKQYIPPADMAMPKSGGQRFSPDFEGRTEQIIYLGE